MQQPQDRAVGSVRVWDAAVAVAFFVFGAVVVWDSRRLGSEWASDGPQAGYFPFYIGLIICIASVANLIIALNSGSKGAKPFVTWGQMRMVLTVMVPSIVYVALIRNPVYSLGIYEASVVFIAFFMRVLGKYSWPKIAAVSVGVMTVFFLMFEVWFKVPLPKGPLEALIGFE
jgi:putative tricarboxylic transport membrane protein